MEITRLSREEAKRRVVHTKLAYKGTFVMARRARRHGDDSTTKCPLKMVPWETEESVEDISQAICPERDLTCVLPATSTAGKVPRAISHQGIRWDRAGEDGEAHACGVRVSVEFCKRGARPLTCERREICVARWSTLQLYGHTIHFDRAHNGYDILDYRFLASSSASSKKNQIYRNILSKKSFE